MEVPAGKREGNETHEEGLLREVKEETGYISLSKPILLGEFMVNPATQNNMVKTYLIQDAFKRHDQDLDDTEDIKVKLYEFDRFGDYILTNKIKTQLFTVNAYLLAKNFILEKQQL
ncbi:NUDIX hydrolase [Metabacillus sp. YM-086]|uniref:NUDIX hydrolase n=1 Tax=Metabacillus sp. YM-086 TaxID=3341729 RepID=UPI003A840C70